MIPLTIDELALATRGSRVGGVGDRTFAGVGIDTRTLRPGEAFFCIRGQQFDGHAFAGVSADQGASVVVHDRPIEDLPGGVACIRVEDTRQALADLASWVRARCRAKVVAITGSVGKTTTKEMLGHLLSGSEETVWSEKSFNNDIGVPLTLLSIEPQTRYAVVEIGGNHPGEIRRLAKLAAPDAGILTRIGRAHLGGFGSIEGVVRAKSEMLESLIDRKVFFNSDDDRQVPMSWGFFGHVVTYGTSRRAMRRIRHVRESIAGLRFRIGSTPFRVPILGGWNVESAGAALAYCLEEGFDPTVLAERMASFRGVPMRMKLHRFGNVTVLNDAYNACPDSVEAAAGFLARRFARARRVFVLGDMLELGSETNWHHRRIGKRVAELGIEALVTVGRSAAIAAESARVETSRNGGRIEIRQCQDVEEAGVCLDHFLTAGDRILLKGSRRVGLEQLVERVRYQFGRSRRTANREAATSAAR